MDVWPWIAVAGAGALHAVNPLAGWPLVACAADPRRALGPLALGHAAAFVGVAVVVAVGGAMGVWPAACGIGLAVALWRRRRSAGLAWWSCGITAVQGSSTMLLPALVPLCLSGSPARSLTASGSLWLAGAAAAVHVAAMAATTAALAWGGRRCISILGRHECHARPQPRR